jgi:hypothetical protein
MSGQTATDMVQRVWTPAEVVALGVRTDVPTAGEILAGLCRDEAYRSVKRGDFPVPVLKIGRRLVVPVAPILELLGIKPGVNATAGGPQSLALTKAGASAEDANAA